MIASVLTRFEELSGDYRIVLDKKPPHDFLPVHAELAKGQTGVPGLEDRITAEIKSALGAAAKVTIKPAGTFPVTEGKTQRVIRKTP